MEDFFVCKKSKKTYVSHLASYDNEMLSCDIFKFLRLNLK
jgi:hypothetical protein